MAISKIIYNGVTQIDLTGDTVDASNLISPNTAHKNDGTQITGSITPATITVTDLVNSTGTTCVIITGAETWETLYDGSCTAYHTDGQPYNYFWIPELQDIYLAEGSKWRITMDGTTYVSIAEIDDSTPSMLGTIYIGNPVYFNGTGTDNGSPTPYYCYNAGHGAWAIGTPLEANIEHTIKVERPTTT